jgi:hypothetical protein
MPDLVSEMALRSPRVEVAGVLIALHERPELAPLLPVHRSTAHRAGELSSSLLPQLKLTASKNMRFLDHIQKSDNKTTIIIKTWNKPVPFFPNLSRRAVALDARSKIQCGVAGRPSRRPTSKGGGKEGGVEEPRVLKAEVRGVGDGCGGRNEEGVVIGGGAGKGGQRGVGENRVPVGVEKGPI